MIYELILFDLDGTLIDTLEAISKVINMTMKEMNLKNYSLEESREYIGYGVKGIVDRIFYVEKYDDNKVDYKKMLEIIKKYYKVYFNYNVKLYDNIEILLDFINDNNIKMGIVTNKDNDLAVKTANENLSKWKFIEVVGANDDKHPRKPAPYGVNMISEKYNISKEKILFVGDMKVDVETAKNAKVDIVYCTWGFGAGKKEKDIDEKIKVSTVEELIEKIKK